MTRDHIAAARSRIDRSRRRLDGDGRPRATQDAHAVTPARAVPSTAHPPAVDAAPTAWCLACGHHTPAPANYCRQCGSSLMHPVVQAVVRTNRRIFSEAARSFAPFLEREGIPVDPFWREIEDVFADPAQVQHDEDVIRRWYAGSGLDYDAEVAASKARGRAWIHALLRRLQQA